MNVYILHVTNRLDISLGFYFLCPMVLFLYHLCLLLVPPLVDFMVSSIVLYSLSILSAILLLYIATGYIGCYRDKRDRAMTGDWTNGADMTIDLCRQRCAHQVMIGQ